MEASSRQSEGVISAAGRPDMKGDTLVEITAMAFRLAEKEAKSTVK